MTETNLIPMWSLLAAALAFLVPLGVALIAAGGLPEREARQAALVPLAAFALAVVGYVIVGFGLHYGGIGLMVDHPDLAPLVWEWSALNEQWGTAWGMAGMAGFGLKGVQTPLAYLLLLCTLPGVATAVLLPMLALRGRAPALATALFGLFVAMVGYPLVANWVQGGGWLANLGYNIGAGHGFVDFGGSAPFLLGGGAALAAILAFLRREPKSPGPIELPPVHLPLLAMTGAGLILVGSTGWLIAWPLTDWSHILATKVVLNGLLAAAGGAFVPLLYTWFVASRPDPLQAARGVAAGWVAGLAGAPFVPPLAALLIGAIAGLLMILTTYAVDHWLRLNDRAGVLATFGLPALVGLLLVGVFADGGAGVGYNGTGASDYLGVAGQGVSGLRVAAGFTRDWPGQLTAQTIGVGVIFLLAFLATTVLAVPLAVVVRAWSRMVDAAPVEQETASAGAEAVIVAPANAPGVDGEATLADD